MSEVPRHFDEVQALHEAILEARRSPCAKSQRGVVVFHPRCGIFGRGHNGPPPGFRCDGSESCRAHCNKLCVHAEMVALLDASRDPLFKQVGHELELMHVKVVDGNPVVSGDPSCWQCSREILSYGIRRVWLAYPSSSPLVLQAYLPDRFHELTLLNNSLPVLRSGASTDG